MKKQLIHLIMVVLVGGFSSCNSGYENDIEENGREIDFRINISHTRTVTEEKVTTFVVFLVLSGEVQRRLIRMLNIPIPVEMNGRPNRLLLFR